MAVLYWSRYQVVYADDRAWGLVSVLVMLIPGIGATHVYKIIAHRRGWIQLNIWKLWPILILALLVLSSFYYFIGYVSTRYIFGPQNIDALLGMATGGVRYMAIWLLAFHLYHFGISRKQAEMDQKHYENLAIRAQYKRLNAELNPHFLFNALNSIKALTLENPEQARNGIDLLSNMLRSSLTLTRSETITVTEELERIEHYIALEKIRYEERLIYDVHLDPAVNNRSIPPLIIYNLVENAVVHNISKYDQVLKIKLDIRLVENKLQIRVKNSGQLNEPIRFGTGLTNVQERLTLLHGQHAHLTVKNFMDNQILSEIIIER